MEKKLEILVIEDDEKHLADAKAYFSRQIVAGASINVTYTTNLQDTLNSLEAQNRGATPFVFCTDTSHHGIKTEPINHYATRSNNIEVIDCGYGKQEGDRK